MILWTTKTKTRSEEIAIGISEENRASLVESLNGLLANLFVLYTKARSYHWNVTGEQFFTLHVEFEKLYDGLAEDLDAVAERARSLGGYAAGSMGQFLELATLKEASGVPAANAMVSDLCGDYERMISKLRPMVEDAEEANDAGTADFLTGLMESYEKTAWMLRSFLH
ncbi:MAG: Dps family protein [Bryobacterales bacterium]|nr:Dps family protein [Bryobacterales bacterium]